MFRAESDHIAVLCVKQKPNPSHGCYRVVGGEVQTPEALSVRGRSGSRHVHRDAVKGCVFTGGQPVRLSEAGETERGWWRWALRG